MRIGKARKEDVTIKPIIVTPPVPVEPIKPIPEKEITPFQKYCLHLAKYAHRPAKQDTLLNSIKAMFKDGKVNSNEILAKLIKQGVVTINSNKVSYNQQRLNSVIE